MTNLIQQKNHVTCSTAETEKVQNNIGHFWMHLLATNDEYCS